MTLIDGDKIITGKLYDDESEEITEQKLSIIDYINAYTDEGVTTADDVLDKIRAEIEQLKLHKARFLTNDNKVCIDSQEVLNIIDKYKAESEREDGNK